MKKIAIVAGVLLSVVACSDQKSQEEAVADVREALRVPESVSDAEVREVMWHACDALDENRVAQVVDLLDLPTGLSMPVIVNAAEAFCPEHLDAVRQYVAEND